MSREILLQLIDKVTLLNASLGDLCRSALEKLSVDEEKDYSKMLKQYLNERNEAESIYLQRMKEVYDASLKQLGSIVDRAKKGPIQQALEQIKTSEQEEVAVVEHQLETL